EGPGPGRGDCRSAREGRPERLGGVRAAAQVRGQRGRGAARREVLRDGVRGVRRLAAGVPVAGVGGAGPRHGQRVRAARPRLQGGVRATEGLMRAGRRGGESLEVESPRTAVRGLVAYHPTTRQRRSLLVLLRAAESVLAGLPLPLV